MFSLVGVRCLVVRRCHVAEPCVFKGAFVCLQSCTAGAFIVLKSFIWPGETDAV